MALQKIPSGASAQERTMNRREAHIDILNAALANREPDFVQVVTMTVDHAISVAQKLGGCGFAIDPAQGGKLGGG